MGVPVVLAGTQVPQGETIQRWYELQARAPRRVPRIVGAGDARIFVSTDAVTSGTIANLTTLFATQIAAGLVLFPIQSLTALRFRCYGRGTAASLAVFSETSGVVLMNTGPTPAVSTATPAASTVNALVGAPTAPTVLLAVSGNDVVVNFTGTATAFQWIIDINIEDPVPVPAGA